MTHLKVQNLFVQYGAIAGTNDISFSLSEGETLALIGSNGAGKSSTLKAILGLAKYPNGDIFWNNQSLKFTPTHDILRMGIGYSPEGRRVFSNMSVQDNLKVGGYTRSAHELLERIEQIYSYFPRLKERNKQDAGSLSGGEQQMLAIGRALMSYPKLFLLDEPSLGLAPIIVQRIGEILIEIQATEKISIILAEQNAAWALNIAKHALVLELGVKVAEGLAIELKESSKIKNAFLGLH